MATHDDAPLVGSTSAIIKDNAIVASSCWSDRADHGLGQMWRSRLNNSETSWCAGKNNTDQWIQWDFGKLRSIRRIQTKGRANCEQWVVKFRLTSSTDGVTFTDHMQEFLANTDKDSLVANDVEPAIVCSVLRLHPLEWHKHISMRAEVLGGDAIGPDGTAADRCRRVSAVVRNSMTDEFALECGPFPISATVSTLEAHFLAEVTAPGVFYRACFTHGIQALKPAQFLQDLLPETEDAAVLQLGFLWQAAQADVSRADICDLAVQPHVSDAIIHCGSDNVQEALLSLSAKFPSLTHASVHLEGKGSPQMWSPLMSLNTLTHLEVNVGTGMRSALYDALMTFQEGSMQLLSFVVQGAMTNRPADTLAFVERNVVLSPFLERFTVYYTMANPAQYNDSIIKALTRRYSKLKRLEVGSCCGTVSDNAFEYFTDNPEGVQAGLELEYMYLCCVTNLRGARWLDPESVRKHLPKLKELCMAAGRNFCGCGQRGCGEDRAVVDRLQVPAPEGNGIKFNHWSAHW